MDNQPGIIKSILDNDLYKITQQNAVCQLFPTSNVRYKLINRGKTIFPRGFDKRLREEISKMANLSLKREEKEFLQKKCGRYLSPVYLDFLSGYRFDPSEVGVVQFPDGTLEVSIGGYWYRTILWEVPLMALICELYYKESDIKPAFDRDDRQKNNTKKMQFFYENSMILMEFGTRRRFSFDNQLEACKDFKNTFGSNKVLRGTSNVYIAMLLDLTPLGTYAHEFVSGIAALKGYTHANKHAMDAWVDVYGGELGVALPDTFGLDSFLKGFNMKYSKLYDGVRHDSGSPFVFIDKMVAHYKSLNIEPTTKRLVFSNNLNKDTAKEISIYCMEKGSGINAVFGIGTNLSNDVGQKPLNIVVKLVEIDGHHVIKLSDDFEKHIGDEETINYVKWLLNYNNSTSNSHEDSVSH